MQEKHRLVVSCTHPDQGLNLQPRHVPLPGTELATFCFAGWCPNKWATPVRAFLTSTQVPPHHHLDLPQWGGVHRPPKVCDLHFTPEPQQQVLWLNIPVNHLILMAVGQGICQLLHYLCEQRKRGLALTGVAEWIGRWPANQKVAGLIPGQDACLDCGSGPGLRECERQPLNVSLPLFLHPFPSKNK